jgi:hypothetical protein
MFCDFNVFLKAKNTHYAKFSFLASFPLLTNVYKSL